MSRGRREKKEKKNAERLLQEAFGVSDEQLFNEFILAQTEVKDSEIPPEPEDGFERLMAKLEQEVGAESSVKSDPIKFEEHVSIHKPRRLKTILKVSLAAAVVAVLVGATGISAGAKREYRYVVRERDSVRNDIVLNSVHAIPGEDELDRAYTEIYKKTGSEMLRMAYMPPKLKYLKTEITGTQVCMYFQYGKKRFIILQQTATTGKSLTVMSDRLEYKKVFNDYLNQEINVEKAKTDGGEVEYSASVINGNQYYYLYGIISEKDFLKIIENIYTEK